MRNPRYIIKYCVWEIGRLDMGNLEIVYGKLGDYVWEIGRLGMGNWENLLIGDYVWEIGRLCMGNWEIRYGKLGD